MAEKVKPYVVIIVQARMGATRLPGKPLKEVLDKPLLGYLIERLKKVKLAQKIVIATTTNPMDFCIVQLCKKEQVSCFQGSEEDVLDRYYQVAKNFQATVVVRITADCPLIDPKVIDLVIDHFLEHFPKYDYVSNTLKRTFPRGMDVEVFSFKSLEEAALEAKLVSEREHVTPFIYRQPQRFKLLNVTWGSNQAHHRWTVDTLEDFRLISTILEDLYPQKPNFTLENILAQFEIHPEWIKINAHVQQKEL